MVLSQRERYMAVVIGVVAGLGILYYVIVSPMVAWGTEIDERSEKAGVAQQQYHDLKKKERDLTKVYTALKATMKADVSEAQSQMDRAVYDWAAQSGVAIATAANAGSNAYDPKTGFTEVGYSVTCSGSTVAIAKLLYQIETAPIPIRIKTVQLRAKKDGVDDLGVELSLSTLCVAPKPAGAAGPANVTPAAPNS